MIYAIGIDTGTKTGFAVKNMETGKFERIETLQLHLAFDLAKKYIEDNKDDVCFVVEDARKRRWFGNAGREKLQGVGSVKRDCSAWEEFLTYYGAIVRFEPPKARKTKVPVEVWQRATGWTGRTSEHARDAAMLVTGLTRINFKIYFPGKNKN